MSRKLSQIYFNIEVQKYWTLTWTTFHKNRMFEKICFQFDRNKKMHTQIFFMTFPIFCLFTGDVEMHSDAFNSNFFLFELIKCNVSTLPWEKKLSISKRIDGKYNWWLHFNWNIWNWRDFHCLDWHWFTEIRFDIFYCRFSFRTKFSIIEVAWKHSGKKWIILYWVMRLIMWLIQSN